MLDLAAVYSSPLLRAVQTAQAIALRHGHQVQTVADLIEVDVGRWEGWAWEQIEAAWPEEYRHFMEDPASNPYLDGETMEQIQQRAMPAWDALLQRHAGQTIAVVTHNVVNRVLLAPLLGLPLRQARRIHQDNCGINVVLWRGGQAKLVTLNSVWHVGGERTG